MTHVGYGIKPLTTTRIPQSHVVMAVRSRMLGGAGVYRETWRVASTRHWTCLERGVSKADIRNHWESADIWRHISDRCRGKGLTFLWTHDLSRTARISGMLHGMPAHGWQLEALSLNPGAAWMVFRRKEATVKVVDVQSIWPVGMEQLAKLFGMQWFPGRESDAADSLWLHAITQDRKILQAAVESYLDWLQDNELGSLAVTGNGQGFAAFRRRFMTDGILVHNDETLYEFERRAMWTGRAEAFWHGAILRHNVDEWDFSNAYTNIAATTPVPVFPDGPVSPYRDWRALLDNPNRALLAEVEVTTDVPVVPVQREGHIVWPVGRFTTVLWGPEIRDALHYSESVRLVRGWEYRCVPALAAWADWLLGMLDADDTAVPAWQKSILKRWGNVVIGRFGMRYPKWQKIGRSNTSDVYAIPGWTLGEDDEWLLMQVGHELWQQVGVTRPHYSAPMITGYIMSTMRSKLWALMNQLNEDSLLYVDTDSVLVSERVRPWMASLSRRPEFRGLRLKRSWDGMAIYGPRQVVTGDAVRISGIPKTAQRIGRHDFEGEVTQSLEQALAGNTFDEVRSTIRRWHVEGTDPRRIGRGVGWTAPHRIWQEGQ